jgi:hypothetical protein
MPKDLFSEQSEAYFKYRPGYPVELFEYILGYVQDRKLAWDCVKEMDRQLQFWLTISIK